MSTRWAPIKGYPEYEVSSEGEVYNKRRDMMVSRSASTGGAVRVNLWNGREMKTHIVKNLVGRTFLQSPLHESHDTVMIKDGNPENCHVRNLCWRPRWYVNLYAVQFDIDLFKVARPVYNATRGIHYPNVEVAGLDDGIRWEDIVNAANQQEPTIVMHYIYEWYNEFDFQTGGRY